MDFQRPLNTRYSLFRYASPCLCNQLPLSLRQPHSDTSFINPPWRVMTSQAETSNPKLCIFTERMQQTSWQCQMMAHLA